MIDKIFIKKRFLGLLTTILIFLLLFFTCPSKASRTMGEFGLELESFGNIKTAFDCNFMYLLTKDEIIKFSLPDLTRISSVSLPLKTQGIEIKIAGQCSDPKRTLLVLGNRRLIDRPKRGQGLILLSYSEDLNLITSKDLKDELTKLNGE